MRSSLFYAILALLLGFRMAAQSSKDPAALLGLADSLYASNPDSSYQLGLRAGELAKASGNKLLLAQSMVSQGRYLLLKSELEAAEERFNAALQILQTEHDAKSTATAYRLKSILQKRIGNKEEAVRLMEESIRLCGEAHDEKGELSGLLNILLDYIDLRQFDKAKATLETIEARLPQMPESSRYYYYQNRGTYNMALQQYGQAITQFMNALDIARRNQMIDSEATILMKLGNGYRLLLDFTNAKKYLLQSEAVCLGHHLDHELVETYDELIQLYQQTGDYAMAYNYLKVNTELREKIMNIEKLNRINELEKKLAFSEKQKELDNEKLNVQSARLHSQRLLYLALGIACVAVLVVFLFIRTRSLKNKIEEKSFIIEEKQKEILDSIHYAKRIQNTLLVNRELMTSLLGEHFILYKPKDIVSGDFYWATEKNGEAYLAVCDSTGHGVPGAFMSLLNINFLNEAINEKQITSPADVFNWVRGKLVEHISQHDQKDGMDGVLLKYDKASGTVTYAAAYNAPLLISGGKAGRLYSDKMPVGKGEKTDAFSGQVIQVKPGDMLYLYTDGYADQFGGPKGKKFKYKQLEELLLTLSPLPADVQGHRLGEAFEAWRGPLEQVDDVLIIGFRI